MIANFDTSASGWDDDFGGEVPVCEAFERERQRIVEDRIEPADEDDEDAKLARNAPTLYRRMLNDVTTVAMEYAISIDASVNEFEWEIAQPGIAIIQDLRNGLIGDRTGVSQAEKWRFWRHQRDARQLIGTDNQPVISRSYVESAASEYLALPYRSALIERTLIDVLIACEMFAFGEHFSADAKFRRRCIPGLSSYPYSGLVLGYVWGQIKSGVLLLGGAAIAYNSSSLIGGEVAGWIGGIAIALFVLRFIISTLAAPYAFWTLVKLRRGPGRLMSEMLRVYAELDTDGAISPRRIREVVAQSAEKGVVWPPPLFAVLDDMVDRRRSV
jgi:hypothetical protein